MDKLIIKKSMNLSGEVMISGAKNAALPIICAGILTKNTLKLTNVPHLKDIQTLMALLQQLGVTVKFSNSQMEITADNIHNTVAPYELVKQMRASILVLGPLLARFGEAKVSLPGGCAIGARPVDIHIRGLEAMGAEIKIEHGYIVAKAHKLKGAKITMETVTVTGTENLLMAASLADGVTILENCALEPEVTDLANCLVSMGAKIDGIGTGTLTIHGVLELHEAHHEIISDRIEAGTYMIAAAITQGNVTLKNLNTNIMGSVIDSLKLSGAEIKLDGTNLNIQMRNKPHHVNVSTAPYPDFPTDMQAQYMVLNTIAEGISTITENIFENRYMHVSELVRMGAKININGNVATITGVPYLTGAKVMATDLRASASLVLAGLVANGETLIDRIYHLDRGYENMEAKLIKLGANISRVT